MKKSCTALLAIAFVGIAPAFADNTDTKTVTVSGKVVASLQLAVVNNLTMPNLVKPGLSPTGAAEGATSVAVVCGGANSTPTAVTYTGGGNPFVAGVSGDTTVTTSNNYVALAGATVERTGQCAELTVTGETDYYFGVTAAVGTQFGGATGLTLSDPACYAGSATPLGTTGVQLSGTTKTIYCGAKVTADTSAASTYSASADFTVQVIYD